MTDQVWRFIALVGGAVFVVGLYLGFSSVSVPALNMAENCGSAFQGSDYATNGSGSLIVAECDSKRQDRQTQAIVVLLAGGLIGGYAVTQSSLRWNALSMFPWMGGKATGRDDDE